MSFFSVPVLLAETLKTTSISGETDCAQPPESEVYCNCSCDFFHLQPKLRTLVAHPAEAVSVGGEKDDDSLLLHLVAVDRLLPRAFKLLCQLYRAVKFIRHRGTDDFTS